MAIVQVSVPTESNIKTYRALTTDPIATYPIDCAKYSRMEVMNDTTKIQSCELEFDGVTWKYIDQKTTMADLLEYHIVTEIDDDFLIDVNDKLIKKVCILIDDDSATKTISLENVSTECDLTIEIDYTVLADITFFSGVTWNVDPIFVVGNVYSLRLITKDGGTSFIGMSNNYTVS